jgi:hypothetical protein
MAWNCIWQALLERYDKTALLTDAADLPGSESFVSASEFNTSVIVNAAVAYL